MSKGLESFLQKIKKSPQNKTYVDRFLALLINEPSRVRLKLLYKLAVMICRHQTLVALKVAYMALQEARAVKKVRHEIEVLQLIENCFKLLGKKEKVALIAKERENLTETYKQNMQAAKASEAVKPVPPAFEPIPPKSTAKLPKLPDLAGGKPNNNLRIHRQEDQFLTKGRGPQKTDDEFGKNVLAAPEANAGIIRPKMAAESNFQTPSPSEKKYERGEFSNRSGSEPYSKQVMNQFRMKETTVGKSLKPENNEDENANAIRSFNSNEEQKSGKRLLSEALGSQKPTEVTNSKNMHESYAEAEAFFREDSDRDFDQRASENDFEPVYTAVDKNLPKPAPKQFGSEDDDDLDIDLGSFQPNQPTQKRDLIGFSDDSTSLLRSSSHFDVAAAREASNERQQKISEAEAEKQDSSLRRKVWFIFSDRISSYKGSSLEMQLAAYLRQYEISLHSEVFQKFVSRLEIWKRSKSDGTLYEIEELFFTFLTLAEQKKIFFAMGMTAELAMIWSGFLKSLTECGKARKALMLIEARSDQLQKADIDWVKASYSRLESIWSQLSRTGFRWEGESVDRFKVLIRKRNLPELGRILA